MSANCRTSSPRGVTRAVSPPAYTRTLSPSAVTRTLSPSAVTRTLSPSAVVRALTPSTITQPASPAAVSHRIPNRSPCSSPLCSARPVPSPCSSPPCPPRFAPFPVRRYSSYTPGAFPAGAAYAGGGASSSSCPAGPVQAYASKASEARNAHVPTYATARHPNARHTLSLPVAKTATRAHVQISHGTPTESKVEDLGSSRATVLDLASSRATVVDIDSPVVNSPSSKAVVSSPLSKTAGVASAGLSRSLTSSARCAPSFIAPPRVPPGLDGTLASLFGSPRASSPRASRSRVSPVKVQVLSPSSVIRRRTEVCSARGPRCQEARVLGVAKGATFDIGNPSILKQGSPKVTQGVNQSSNGDGARPQQPSEAVVQILSPKRSFSQQDEAYTGASLSAAPVEGKAESDVPLGAAAAQMQFEGTESGVNLSPQASQPNGVRDLNEELDVLNLEMNVPASPPAPALNFVGSGTFTHQYPHLYIPETPGTEAGLQISPFVKKKRKTWYHLQPHVYATCHNITEALRDRTALKELVVHFFKEALSPRSIIAELQSICEQSIGESIQEDMANATQKAGSNVPTSEPQKARIRAEAEETALDMNGLTVFTGLIATHLDLPPYAFGNLEDAFAMYDFDGQGSLTAAETYKFVKFHLEEYREQLDGAIHTLEIPWKTPTEAGFQILQELGHGNHGIAKLAKKNNSMEVCLKVIKKTGCCESGVEDMIKEYNAMSVLSCERIAGVKTMFQDITSFYMVCDLYRGGDLLCLRENAEKQGVVMTLDWWHRIFKQCVEALAFMHEQAIMHCDIKEANIMLKNEDCKEPEIVVIDLGVSTSCARFDDGTPSGTPGYVPPETLTSLKWYPRGDIFSLGVTIFQVFCGMKPPESGVFMEGCRSAAEIFRATMDKEPPWPQFPDHLVRFKSILADMLQKERMHRPRATRVLLHDCFACDALDTDVIFENG